jgi:hypothetical protein
MHTIRTDRRRSIRGAAVVAALLLTASLASPALARGGATHGHHGHHGHHGQALGQASPGLGAELAQVRAATARYHDVEVALAEGFVPVSPCVEDPDGAGAMGVHLLHEARVGQLDPTLPQVLLYVPRPDGELRLVGVEYLNPSGGEVLGQPLADLSPMGANTALHVWLWQANPAGMFASYNPSLSC